MQPSGFSWGLLVGLCFATSAFAAKPDWAQRMEGNWVGVGQRVVSPTGSRIRVEVRVHSEWRERETVGALVSRNEFHEVQLDAQGNPLRSRDYQRVYWIREEARENDVAQLRLGGGEDFSGPVSSLGTYDSRQFRLEIIQKMGSQVRVQSSTDLSQSGRSDYRETFVIDGSQRVESQIQFTSVF